MSTNPPDVNALRAALDERFGITARGLSDVQLVDAALQAGWSTASRADVLQRVLDLLPISESALFRNPGLWEWMGPKVLSPLLERAAMNGRSVLAVSLGCSQGQEAYSLAMKLLEAGAALGLPRASVARLASILGLDASPERVEIARAGRVNGWSLDRGRREWADPYVCADDREFVVAPEVLALCSFEAGNLLDVAAGKSPLVDLRRADLVLCQHVLVYFDEARARSVIAGLVERLAPGATLVVAAPEAHLLEHHSLEPLGFVGAARVREVAIDKPSPRASPTTRPPRTPLPLRSAPVRPPRADMNALQSELLAAVKAARLDEALDAGERLWAVAPEHLSSRFVLGQALMPRDPAGARLLLSRVVELSASRPRDELVPGADELSVGQMVDAALLLLSSRRGR